MDTAEKLKDLEATLGAVGALVVDAFAILHRIAPDEVVESLRVRRLLIQDAEAGRLDLSDQHPMALLSHTLARDFLEQAVARNERNQRQADE